MSTIKISIEFKSMAANHQTVGRSLLPNNERERDALLTIRQLEKR